MSVELKSLDLEAVKVLTFWIKEREAIRERRALGLLPPWTDDSILANYRFCNVRREDDKVTQWISRHWRTPYRNSRNLTAALVLARMLNNPDTLEAIEFPVNWDTFQISYNIKARRAIGYKILNPAYLITTCGVKMDKVDYIVNVADSVWESRMQPVIGDTLEYFHSKLMMIKGLGNFLAAQVVADLKHTPSNPLIAALDFMSWAAPGPGSLKGLRYVLGGLDVSERSFLPLATAVYLRIKDDLDMPPLEMQDFQNCLCEFSKYWKTHKGYGKPKQRYSPNR